MRLAAAFLTCLRERYEIYAVLYNQEELLCRLTRVVTISEKLVRGTGESFAGAPSLPETFDVAAAARRPRPRSFLLRNMFRNNASSSPAMHSFHRTFSMHIPSNDSVFHIYIFSLFFVPYYIMIRCFIHTFIYIYLMYL